MTEPQGAWGGPEDAAEHAVSQALGRAVLLAAARSLLALAGLALAVLGDYAWAGLALPQFPPWWRAGMAAFLACDVHAMLGHLAAWRRDVRRTRAEQAAMGDDEKMVVAIGQVAAPPPDQRTWWERGPRSRMFWRGLGFRFVYSGCALLALDHFLGSRLAVFLAAAWTVLVMAAGPEAARAMAGLRKTAVLAGPPDSPEA